MNKCNTRKKLLQRKNWRAPVFLSIFRTVTSKSSILLSFPVKNFKHVSPPGKKWALFHQKPTVMFLHTQ